jgi:hypothetical protein
MNLTDLSDISPLMGIKRRVILTAYTPSSGNTVEIRVCKKITCTIFPSRNP